MGIWSIAEKRVLITGASAGIGKATAQALAKQGADLVLAGRSEPRTMEVVGQIMASGGSASFIHMDLADFDSVRQASITVLDQRRPIDVLINNAGIGGTKGITETGFEVVFATNHLGHHLLTRWLTPLLIENAPSRVLIVASSEHHNVEKVDWSRFRRETSSFLGRKEYQQSKLANILFGRHLAHRLQGTGVDVHMVHPGLVASEIWRDMPFPMRKVFESKGQTNAEGADTSIWCATSPDLSGTSGMYYGGRRQKSVSELAADAALAEEMWHRSEEWLEPWLPV